MSNVLSAEQPFTPFGATSHIVIEASAGTGKTFTIENLVVDLVTKGGLSIDQLLVVTFTEKATFELRSRIRARLGRPQADAAEPAAWSAAREAAQRNFESASILTIHAFCHRVLKEEAFAAGRPFGGAPVDAREVWRLAVTDALRRTIPGDLTLGRFLAAAIASGMTTVALEERLWRCHAHEQLLPSLDPSTIATRVFDAARALAHHDELPARLRAVKVHAKTAAKIARELATIQSAVSDFVTERDLPKLLLAIDETDREYLLERLPPLAQLEAPLGTLFSAAVELLTLLPSFDVAITLLLLPLVRSEAAARKGRDGSYDYDDMLRVVADRVESPEGDELVRSLRDRFKVALIDEFQDTDEVQWRLFRKLFFETTDHRLVLVGDPKQSIYRFRGADVVTYLAAKAEVLKLGGTLHTLDANYRSSSELIASYNALLGAGTGSPLLSGLIQYERPVVAGRPDLSLVEHDGSRAPALVVFEVEDEKADGRAARLLDAYAAEIRTITETSPLRFGAGSDLRNVRKGDIFVLTRSRRECALVADAFERAGIPCQRLHRERLFATPEAKHIRDLLLAIDAPGDAGRRSAALLTPFFDLHLDEVERAETIDGGDLAQVFGRWKETSAYRRWPEFFERILEESGVVRRSLLAHGGASAVANYRHVFELLGARGSQERLRLHDLLALLDRLISGKTLDEYATVVERPCASDDAVVVMTTHMSKGLEAVVVFLFGGFESGGTGETVSLFHSSDGVRLAWLGAAPERVRAAAAREAQEEDQRLAYVALTRAKARLYLPYVIEDGDTMPRRAVRLKGPYERVHARLADELAKSQDAAPPPWRIVSVPRSGRETAKNDELSTVRWPLNGAGLGTVSRSPLPNLARLETSYSRLRRVGPTAATPDGAALDGDRSVLGRGLLAGIRLHDLLERADIAKLRACADIRAFSEGDLGRDFVAYADALGNSAPREEVARTAARLVYAAYTTPITPLPGTTPIRLAFAAKFAREVPFELALAPAAEDLDIRGFDASWTRTAGFVSGVMDAVFTHGDKVWIMDWKSDALRSYDPESLSLHARSHYGMQAAIYSLALARALGAVDENAYNSTIGGVLFGFVRAFEHSPAAPAFAHLLRPTWGELAVTAAQLKNGLSESEAQP